MTNVRSPFKLEITVIFWSFQFFRSQQRIQLNRFAPSYGIDANHYRSYHALSTSLLRLVEKLFRYSAALEAISLCFRKSVDDEHFALI